MQNASPAELTQTAVAAVELTTISSLFGAAAPPSDSVNLSDGATAALFGNTTAASGGSSDPILQALDTALNLASNTAGGNAGSISQPTASASSTATSNPGSMFSYMG